MGTTALAPALALTLALLGEAEDLCPLEILLM